MVSKTIFKKVPEDPKDPKNLDHPPLENKDDSASLPPRLPQDLESDTSPIGSLKKQRFQEISPYQIKPMQKRWGGCKNIPYIYVNSSGHILVSGGGPKQGKNGFFILQAEGHILGKNVSNKSCRE